MGLPNYIPKVNTARNLHHQEMNIDVPVQTTKMLSKTNKSPSTSSVRLIISRAYAITQYLTQESA